MRQTIIRYLLLAGAAGGIFWGAARGEAAVVFTRAIHICLECIGLG